MVFDPYPTTTGQSVVYKTPIGIHTIQKTIPRVCMIAGAGRFKTNHSLRVTAASRLYQEGLDEQLIMERIGHRSLDGVRAYKQTSREQQELVLAALKGTRQKYQNQMSLKWLI